MSHDAVVRFFLRRRITAEMLRPAPFSGKAPMLDVVFVLGGLAFFAISIGYTILCDRL